MKKAALILLVVVFLGAITAPAFANGDKNRNRHQGDKEQGKVLATICQRGFGCWSYPKIKMCFTIPPLS